MNDLILISIKTKHANQIFAGTKKYEYRRKSINDKNLNKPIYVYSSKEDRAIIGYIIVDKILKGTANDILKETNNEFNKGILKYFEGCTECYALKIKKAVKFKKPITLKELKEHDNNFNVPQFYRYIKEDEYLYQILKKEEYL